MKKVRCVNHHFYDEDKYSMCPHCGAHKEEVAAEQVSVKKGETPPSKSIKGLFWKKDKTISNETKEESNETREESNEAKEESNEAKEESNEIKKDTSDDSFYLKRKKDVPLTGVMFPPSNSAEGMNVKFRKETLSVKEDVDSAEDTLVAETPSGKRLTRITDLDAVKTVTQFANESGEEPVTGWLVAIEGIYKGNSFSLKAGVNIIGRNPEVYVCLKKDAQVSRNKHAVVIYEPKQKKFYLGEGDALVYCNGELVCGRQELTRFDKIEIGAGIYLFVPLCGLDFDWSINN